MRGYRPRSFGWLATVFVVATTLMAPWPALAQDATPAVSGEPTRSLTREEFTTQLVEELGYTEAETPGGTLVDSSIADIQTVQPFLAEEIRQSIRQLDLRDARRQRPANRADRADRPRGLLGASA